MIIQLGRNDVYLGEPLNEMWSKLESEYIKIIINKSNIIIKSKMSVDIDGVNFRVIIHCKDERIAKVSLIAMQQQSIEYKDIDEIHKQWLLKKYGDPLEIKQWGYIYSVDGVRIYSEYDPRRKDPSDR